MMTVKKKTASEHSPLQASYARVATAVRNLRAVTANKRDLAVVEKYRALTNEYETVVKDFKEYARKLAVTGSTVKNIFQDDDVVAEISVTGIAGKAKYDPKLARKHWSEPILKKVMVVDPAAVKRLIEEGEFDEEEAALAAVEVEDDTPRVSIKLLDLSSSKKAPG